MNSCFRCMAQAVHYAKTHADPGRGERSVHGGLSAGNKILSFFETTKQAASAAGKDMGTTLHRSQAQSRSRILKDVSHHHSAAHAIPKVRGEVRIEEPPTGNTLHRAYG